MVILGYSPQTVRYPMRDYPSYTLINSRNFEKLLHYEQTPIQPSVAISQWPGQQPIAGLSKSAADVYEDEMPGSLMDCFMTMGLIILMLLSSSVLLGFAADRLTQGMVVLVQQQANTAIVSK